MMGLGGTTTREKKKTMTYEKMTKKRTKMRTKRDMKREMKNAKTTTEEKARRRAALPRAVLQSLRPP